jgi:hypothetical protein
MNTLKSVGEKLFKTELASNEVALESHKVDLAINDDVQKAFNDAIAARKKSLDVYMAAKKAVDDALAEMKNLKAINENALPFFAKFDALIKELGIPYPTQIADQKNNIKDGLKGSFANYTKKLESAKL